MSAHRGIGGGIALLALMSIACGTTTGDGSNTGGKGSNQSATQTSTQASTSAASTGTHTVTTATTGGGCAGAMTDTDCKACGSTAACAACCGNLYPTGMQVSNTDYENHCLCNPGSPCELSCMDQAFCATRTNPSQMCQDCSQMIVPTDACAENARLDCNSNTDCEKYAYCVFNCP
jgi:hypothetical protein